MAKLLLLIAIVAVVVLVARAVRSRSSHSDDPQVRSSTGSARAEKLAADQAVTGRHGASQVGGGWGP